MDPKRFTCVPGVEDVITNPRDLKDMEHLAEPYHIGDIEVFHSLITCCAPKRLD